MSDSTHDRRLARWAGWMRAAAGLLVPLALAALVVAASRPSGAALLLAAAGLLIAALLGLIQTVRLDRAQRYVVTLCAGTPPPPRSLGEALDTLAGRLALIGHRSETRNPTTKLPTREQLFECDIQAGALLAVLRLLDHDRLAAFDPAAAQAVLAACADRLAAAVGDRHLLVQVDRDVFAILFRSDDAAASHRELRALTYVAVQELTLDEMRVAPSLCCGSAIAGLAEQPEQLLARALADMAAPDLPAATLEATSAADDYQERFLLEQGLARAIIERELHAVFQPVVNLAMGRVVGAEALIRWHHPKLGPVPPSRFMPIAESLGLSDRLGMWMLERGAQAARGWRDAGLGALKVAVNLSACQLHDESLPTKVQRILERHGLPASALELELTETAAMADVARTRALFSAMHGIGIAIAIDDFGAGYSSLSYLKNLRFDKLKIDREFVTHVDRRRDSQAICKALVELGRGLDLAVLAEGVETSAEVATLRSLGCTLFQGFHFSRPVEEEAFCHLAGRSADLSGLHTDRIEDRISA